MNQRVPIVTLLSTALWLPQVGAATLSCHIHLPSDHPLADGRPTIIQNVGDRQACEALNRERYDHQGRCHCTFGGVGGERVLPGDPSPSTPNRPGPPTLP
jgi:hypothetical protein